MTAPLLSFKVRQPDWAKVVRDAVALPVEDRIRVVFEEVGTRMVAWLKSLSQEERGWANITGHLADSYRPPKVEQVTNGWRLTLANTAFYSVFLEARDGMMVLSGVTDPGGPFDQKLREVCADVAPDFIIVLGRVRAARRFR